METKQHWKKVFNSEYIGSSDLEDYNDIVLTIKEVKQEITKNKNNQKDVDNKQNNQLKDNNSNQSSTCSIF